MSAQVHVSSAPSEELPVGRTVEKLARLCPMVMLLDAKARVVWASPAWNELCGGERAASGRDLRVTIPSLPQPDQSFAILSELRTRGFLLRAPVQLIDRQDLPVPVEVSIFPLASPEGSPRSVVVARRVDEPGPPTPGHPLLDAAPDALIAVDANGFVTFANRAAAELLGIEAAELRRVPLPALADGAESLQDLLRALDSPAAQTLELDLRRGSGGPIPVSVSVPAGRPDDSPHGAVLSLRDARPSRHVESELSRRNEELEHCVNALAHDLRSPLVALLGFSRLLRQDYGDRLDDTGTHFIDRIEQAGRTMEALIHDLLELSRIGQPGERLGMVDPRTVLMQLSAELKPRIDERGLELVLPQDPPLVYCDRTRLYQLFSNLIGNAVEHLGEARDRRIVVEIREQSEGHRLSVQDFGGGIDPEHHERIFEVFQTLGQRGRGTGMGLAIVRKIAETHEGRAWVESEPGRGAAFHVLLPRR